MGPVTHFVLLRVASAAEPSDAVRALERWLRNPAHELDRVIEVTPASPDLESVPDEIDRWPAWTPELAHPAWIDWPAASTSDFSEADEDRSVMGERVRRPC